MTRVVVLLVALTQMPLVAVAVEPAAKPPAMRAPDPYYLKRAQVQAGVGATPVAVPSASDIQQAASTAALRPDNNPATTTAAIPRLPLTPQPAGYSYYMQRQAAHQRAAEARLTQYTTEPGEYVEGEEIPSEAWNSSAGEVTGGDVADGESADGCVGNGCVDNGCVSHGHAAHRCSTDSCADGDLSMLGGGGCMAAINSVPTCNVLWNELYSCRCLWTNFDYLGFWVKGNHVPPLVTTSPIGTPQSQAGVLGQPGTRILFGDQRVNTDLRSGGRVTVGGWLVGDVLGIEGNYFNLATADTNYNATSIFSTGSLTDPILARPYFNPAPPITTPPPPHPQLPPQQSATLLAYPGFQLPGGGTADLDGSVHVRASSNLQSAGLLLRRLVGVDLTKDHRMFVVGGYRFFQLEEGLAISDTIGIVGGGIPANSGFAHFDNFGTRNQFNGGDVGLLSDLRRGRWVLETQAKVGLGNMHEYVNIDGQTKVITAGVPVGYPGGVLTQASNIGVYRRNQFAAIPEINFKLGFQITPGLRATAGYNFTYVTRVVRPGNEVDFVVNPPYTAGATQIVARPEYLNNPTNLWLQGFTVGFDYRW